MTSTPADELCTAAEQLRTLARAASTDGKGNPTAFWSIERSVVEGPDGRQRDISRLYGGFTDSGAPWPSLLRGGDGSGGRAPSPHMYTPHAAYIAAMHPAVGTALAAWLEQTVRAVEDDQTAIPVEALAVARAINQQEQP